MDKRNTEAVRYGESDTVQKDTDDTIGTKCRECNTEQYIILETLE